MSSPKTQRIVLEEDLQREVARNLSEQMAQYHQAIASWLGLSLSDHKALDLVCNEGQLTAGQLAEQINLTGGAVTGLVDRLEQAGLVQRVRDPEDRRRVIIQPCVSTGGALPEIYASLTSALAELCARYTDEELAVIHDFTTHVVALLQAETTRLQEQNARAGTP